MHLCLPLRRKKFVIIGLLTLLAFWYIIATRSPSPPCHTKTDFNSQLTKKDFEAFILVVILTGPRNKDRRDAMRQTWLSRSSNGIFNTYYNEVSHLFVLGIRGIENDLVGDLKKEQSQHSDLLLLDDFTDAYEKLTEKLGKTLIWIQDNVKFKYIFKCDDDTFAKLDVIDNELKSRYSSFPNEMLYHGYFYGKGVVKKSGPWKETEWLLCDMYIPYARGGGYILSSSLVSFVASNFHIFKKYKSEDVSMGSWLAPLEVNRVHDVRFDTEYKSRGCSNSFVVCHKQSIEDMHSKYNSLKKTGKLCETEFSNFHGYQYDWKVRPSQCCVRKESIP